LCGTTGKWFLNITGAEKESLNNKGMAMRAISPQRCLVFLILAVFGCALDMATKSWMFGWLGMPGPNISVKWIWPGVFGFQTSLNEGALFGLGQGLVPVFAALSVMAAMGILFWLFFAGGSHDWFLTVALGLITAGIFGNLYDRLGLPGLQWSGPHAGGPVYAVRDFILVMIGPWQWPNFNLADSFLVCGAALLVWHALRGNSSPSAASESLSN
jgi:signal peptidase II